MARATFGGTTADTVAQRVRILGHDVDDYTSATLTVWSAATGGTQYTDLLVNGAASSSVPVDATGQVPEFQGPDGVTLVWVSAGGARVKMLPAEGPSDAGVAGYVNDTASSTRAALNGKYGRKYQSGVEISEDFSTFANGAAPSTAVRTGQNAQNYGMGDIDARQPWISGGKMTYKDTTTGDLGCYRQYPVETNGSRVVYLEFGFTFTSWTTGGGLACIALMEQDFVAYERSTGGVPRSPFHLTISPEAWGLSTFPTAGAASVSRGGGLWSGGNLAADDVTVHRVSAVLDGVNGVAYLFLPDGTSAVVQHADLKIPATYCFVEAYRDAVAGRTVTKITDVQIDSLRADRLPIAKAATKAAVRAAHSFPGSASNMTLTTTASQVTGTSVTFTTPPSGAVLVELQALLDVTVAGPVHFGIFDASNALVAVRTVATKVMNGQTSVLLTYTPPGGAGTKQTISMCAYVGGSAAATIILGNSGSVYGGATVKVTPI